MALATHRRHLKPQRLKGFADFLPDAARVRGRILEVARQQARLAGFAEIDTPTLEYSSTLCGDEEQESSKQMYRFRDHGGRDVGLRFDLTVPFARFVAEHRVKLLLPFRRLQWGTVFRGEKPQRGRYREFQQCDLDIVGTRSSAAEVEIIALFNSILAALRPGRWRMAIGHRALLNAVIGRIFPTLPPSARSELLIVIDKIAKQGRERSIASLMEKSGGSQAQAEELLDTLQADIDGISYFLRNDTQLNTTLAILRETLSTLQQLSGNGDGRVEFDLAIARGLDYYTGLVFETLLDAAPQLGSICSGGRYDNLIARFSPQPCTGVGGSIGVDRLVPHLLEQSSPAPPSQVFVVVATAAAYRYAMLTAHMLRSEGISTTLDVSTGNLRSQLKHVHRGGYRWAAIIGDEEMQTETVTLRDMESGSERKALARSMLASAIASSG